MTNAFVSIVMCTYNGARFLEGQVQSLITQTHQNFELIICDDCSTDNTPDLLKGYAALDQRIRLFINEKNIGYNKNFENAIKKAAGAYICISDQDDIWLPEKIEKLLELIMKGESVLAYHNVIAFTDRPPYEKKVNRKINVLNSSDEAVNIFHNSISGHTMLFNRSILADNISFPPNVYYDWWLSLLALTKGKIAGTNEILSYHRQHDANASAKTGHKKFLSAKECDEKIIAYKAFLSMPGMSSRSITMLNKLIKYYTGLQGRKFSMPLFKYLLSNSATFLKYKKIGFLYINILKTCYRMSRVH